MVFNGFSTLSGKARVLLAVFVLLVAGSTLFAVLHRKPKSPLFATRNAQPDPIREEQLKKLGQDSDEDGLKDWEEEIFRTDPHVSDTDRDGTNDGEEIAQNRDPLRKGPGDHLATSTIIGANSKIMDADNLTHRLVQTFGSRLIGGSTFGSGASTNGASAGEQIIQSILSATTSNPILLFSKKDIAVSSDNSAAGANAYIRSFNAAVHGSFRGLEDKPEIVIFSEALETDDFGRLAQLDKYLEGFERATLLLKRIVVPSDFADLHVAYLNNLVRQQAAVGTMRRAEIDIVKAALGVREYAATANIFIQIVQDMRKELRKKSKA